MKAPSSITDIRAELADIESKIAELRTLTARRERLVALLRQFDALYGATPKKQTKQAATTPEVKQPEQVPSGATNAHYIAHVLLGKGPMDMSQILREVRLLGWTGSGDDPVDKKRLYAAMHGDPRFKKTGEGNKWIFDRQQNLELAKTG
jgi:hypothetical protein